MTGSRTGRRSIVAVLALAYLAFLPLGHLLVVPVAGAMATLTDIALAALVASALVASAAELVGGRIRAGGLAAGPVHAGLGPGGGAASALLLAYGAWVGTSALWSPHVAYAGAKGAGTVLLVAGAWVLATSRVRPGRLADAWLGGAAVALVLTLLLALPWSPLLHERVVYRQGLVDGLPFPRFRGPFPHPNLLGDWLAVTGLLLWARWPAWRGTGAGNRGAGLAAPILAGLLALALLLSVSSGWLTLGGGVLALAVAAPGWRTRTRWAVAAAGAALIVPTALGLVEAVSFGGGPLVVRSGGIRPEIWADAANAVLTAPVVGVGAAPYLAETADPLGSAATAVWDAHSTYLSVAGQFGLVGAFLFFGGLGMLVRAVFRAGKASAVAMRPGGEGERGGAAAGKARSARARSHHRLAVAVLAAGAGLLLHWTSIAGEDMRHLWALVGLGLALTVAGQRDAASSTSR